MCSAFVLDMKVGWMKAKDNGMYLWSFWKFRVNPRERLPWKLFVGLEELRGMMDGVAQQFKGKWKSQSRLIDVDEKFVLSTRKSFKRFRRNINSLRCISS